MPLVSPGVDKLQQKQRWKFVLEKFSHNNHRRNPIPAMAEAQILEMPECKRGRFVAQPAHEELSKQQGGKEEEEEEREEEGEGDREMEDDGEVEVAERIPRPVLMQNHSNLLDVEPVVSVCNRQSPSLPPSSSLCLSPQDCDEEDCTLESLATMDSTIPCPKSISSPSPPPPSQSRGSALTQKVSVLGECFVCVYVCGECST